jgi:hypothetical protein
MIVDVHGEIIQEKKYRPRLIETCPTKQAMQSSPFAWRMVNPSEQPQEKRVSKQMKFSEDFKAERKREFARRLSNRKVGEV